MTMVERVGWVLVHFVWQGAAIALALWVILLLSRRARATLRYALSCAALALMLLAPLVTAARLARVDAAPPGAAPLSAAPSVTTGAATSASLAARRSESASPLAATRVDASPLVREAGGVGAASAQPAPASARDSLSNDVDSAAWQWTVSPSVRARVVAALPWLVVVWAVGVLLLSVRLAGGWWRTRALRLHGIALMPTACQQAAARLMERMRIARPVAFFISTRVTVPIVFGHVKPVVLVPAAVLAGLSPSQLDAIIAHELAHVRRHDYLVNLLQTVIETVLFYHPAVWWVSRQVRIAREECCDDIAVAACGDRRDYVEALLGLEQLRDAATAALALGATDGSLLSRARRILRDAEREGATPRLTASVIAMAVAALAIAGISTAATEPIIGKGALAQAAGSSGASGSAGSAGSAGSVGSAASANGPASSASLASQASLGSLDPLGSLDSLKPGGDLSASTATAAPADAAAQMSTQPPQPVKPAPDQAAPLAARRAWADREARTERAARYWIGYAVRPVQGMPPFVYMDQRGTIVGDHITLSGHFYGHGADHFRFPGRPLAIAGADPSSMKILFAFNANDGGSRLTDVHVSTMPLPVDLGGRPIFWLGAAETGQSLDVINRLYDQAATLPLKKELLSAVEVHDDSPAVVAWLDRHVRGNEADELRAEAVEGMAWHPIPAALAAIDRAAHQDRASRVRQEAAEALGDLKMPEAVDKLIAIAKALDDRDARREAVEALGERPEQPALDALTAIAKQDADLDIQREAVETLGDVKDGRGVPALRELARRHAHPDIRREAIETLGDALPGEAAVDLLKEIAREDADPNVQAEAVETLGDIDRPDARAAVQDLMRSHKDARVRREAIETMVDHAEGKKETVEVLTDIIQKDVSVEVRHEAIDKLSDVHDEAAKQALIDLARTHADEDIRAQAVESLGDGDWGKALGDVLKQIVLTDRSTRVRHEAVDVLAGLPDGAGIDALIVIAREHTDQELRKEALEALMESKHPRARAIFDRALQKP